MLDKFRYFLFFQSKQSALAVLFSVREKKQETAQMECTLLHFVENVRVPQSTKMN